MPEGTAGKQLQPDGHFVEAARIHAEYEDRPHMAVRRDVPVPRIVEPIE